VPKIVDKDARRAAIIEAATAVFARHGFKGTSVDDIAAAAAMSKGNLYGYFSSKEDLFFATFEAFEMKVAGELLTVLADHHLPARERLATGLMTTTGTLLENIHLFPLTLEVWAAASAGSARTRFSSAMQGLYRQFRDIAAGLIREGQANGEFIEALNADAVAAWLVGGLDGLVLQAWFDPDIDVRTWTGDFLDTILRGIAVPTDTGDTP